MPKFCTYKTRDLCVCLDDTDLCPTLIAARKMVNELTDPKDQIADTLAERGDRYGDFLGHAQIAQDLQHVMHHAEAVAMNGVKRPAWDNLSNVQRQALTVIMDKVARILNGDPDYDDNWIDIQGYAKLAQDRLAPKAKIFIGKEQG